MNLSFLEIFIVISAAIFLWLLIEFIAYRSKKKDGTPRR